MTQTIEQLIAELRDEEIHTFDGFTVADVLEQLTARVRELEEQYELAANLANTSMDRVHELEEEKKQLEDDCGYQMQWKREFREQLEYSQKQLAAAQLHAEQLRVALLTCQKKQIIYECRPTQNYKTYDSDLVAKALSIPRDTSALDAYVSEKVKEAVSTQKEYYESVFQDGAKRIANLTRQRDLAVEALEWALSNINCEPFEWSDEENADAHKAAIEALSAIKESKAK